MTAGPAKARITYTREVAAARMPTPEEPAGLMLPDSVPVLVVLHTGLDEDGPPFEVAEFVMRADCTGLDDTMPVDDCSPSRHVDQYQWHGRTPAPGEPLSDESNLSVRSTWLSRLRRPCDHVSHSPFAPRKLSE